MKYCPEIVDRLCKHLKQGSTIQSACAASGISTETFNQWRKKPDFSDSIKKAMAIPDKAVERALHKSAIMGHSYIEKESKAVVSKDGTRVVLIPVKETKKFIPPNVTAQIFWLKNRCRNEFRDKQETELSGDIKVEITRVVTVERPKE